MFPVTRWPGAMFWVQTIQFESTACIRDPRRSWETLKKTPFTCKAFWAVCRSTPMRAGMAKSTTGVAGALAVVVGAA
jgi:hypothetical protein